MASSEPAAKRAATAPSLHFGTMTFGWTQASSFVDDNIAASMLKAYKASGGEYLDTARIYAGGETECVVGRTLDSSNLRGKFKIITKVHPSQPGGLGATGIRAQLKASLDAMKEQKVDVLYLHQPDPENDLTESLQCCHELVQEGLIGATALSNFSVVETERVLTLCEERGWAKPVAFQGLYNGLNRRAEAELLPLLRKHGVAFIAYNPLAAGMLTGKHSKDGDVKSGRFKDNPNYLPRFYTDGNFEAIGLISDACKKNNITMVQAAYCWLLHHSSLSGSADGVLLGASSLAQLDENLKSCTEAVPLPDDIVAAFSRAWEITESSAFPFWRSYSRDQPGREDLDPGAAYQAAKK